MVVVSDDPETRALGRWSIELPSAVPEWLRPIVSILPAAIYLAAAFTVALDHATTDTDRRFLLRRIAELS